MKGVQRRENIIRLLSESHEPVSGTSLAKMLGVSRQVIVQDMALIRAGGVSVISTNQGYVLESGLMAKKVFKVRHTEDETEEELNLIVDHGGIVEDVFVYHKVYGVIEAPLHIKTRMDVKKYMESITTGKSSTLMNVTSGFHYHTIRAENSQVLDEIYDALAERGFLAQLQDYEPEQICAEQTSVN